MKRLFQIFKNPVPLAGLMTAGILLAVMSAAIVTGGFSFAQEDGTTTPSATKSAATATEANRPAEKDNLRDDFLNRLADQLGISADDLTQAMTQVASDMLDQAVADGKLTQDEADAIRARIEAGDVPFFFGRGHHGGPGHGFRHGFMIGVTLDKIATFLGINVSDITDALRNDQSLAQIAEAHGKSRDELKTFILDETKARLDEKVADGGLTQQEADDKLQEISDRVDNLIDRTGFPVWRGHPGMHVPPPMDEGTDQGTESSFTF
jgi:polyhydroxyalkanoate synthesis regulator phasin